MVLRMHDYNLPKYYIIQLDHSCPASPQFINFFEHALVYCQKQDYTCNVQLQEAEQFDICEQLLSQK